MRTDDFGREMAPATIRKSIVTRSARLFVLGAAVGAGLCIGMGPPLPLLDEALSAAAREVPEPADTHLLPRKWLVLRDAVLDSAALDRPVAEKQAAAQLLREKWALLQDALASAWSGRSVLR